MGGPIFLAFEVCSVGICRQVYSLASKFERVSSHINGADLSRRWLTSTDYARSLTIAKKVEGDLPHRYR